MGYPFRKFRPETFNHQETYYFSFFAKEGVALHGVVAVGGNEVEDVVVGGVC